LYSQYSTTKDKEEFVKKYINLLKAGGSDDYTELLKSFGLDPKNKDFWNNGMNVISNLIDEFEELVNSKENK
jgi:oligoendopeptidase F